MPACVKLLVYETDLFSISYVSSKVSIIKANGVNRENQILGKCIFSLK